MHGAMVSEQWEDIEGEVLERLRKIVGTKPIAVILDLHANISEKMVAFADFLIGYDTYPHIDAHERGDEAVRLLVQQINGKIKPHTFLQTCQLLVAPSSMRTESEPMKGLFTRAFEFEQEEGVLDVSIFGGFPYADVHMAGMSIVVVTDGDDENAKRIADDLYQFAVQNGAKFKSELHSMDEACQIASSAKETTVIFVESADNVGGGAPADATHALDVLLKRRMERFLIFITDPSAVQKAFSVGENQKLSCEVGGKTDRKYDFPLIHGEPVLLEGEVQLLSNGEYIHEGKYMTGRTFSMGKTAVIDVAGCSGSKVVLTENIVSPRDPQQLKILHIDPQDYRIIVVKAAIAWRTMFNFEPKHVVELDTAGCCSSNLSHFTFKNIPQSVEIIT